MRRAQRRDDTRDTQQPAKGGGDELEKSLDELALQIIRKAMRKDQAGEPVEPLPLQLQALKIAGSFYALRKKLSPADDDEGGAWASLLGAKSLRVVGDDDEEEDEAENDG